jgi:hypothetical protein
MNPVGEPLPELLFIITTTTSLCPGSPGQTNKTDLLRKRASIQPLLHSATFGRGALGCLSILNRYEEVESPINN